MSAATLLLFVGGIVLLVAGSDLLVRGASRLALAAGISPLVVGLTVVAFGTSTPEIAVSIEAARSGNGDISFGNVVGSNIANVLLVLGLSALIAPLVVHRDLIRREVPLMILASVLVGFLALDGAIGPPDAALLTALLVAWTWWTVRASRAEVRAEKAKAAAAGEAAVPEAPRTWKALVANVLLAGAGFALLILGSDLLVEAAVTVAKGLGVSELVIGLTVVAVGTSLPEIATSVMASFRGARDIAVGNVVGSNLFNLLGVLGLSGLAGAGGIRVDPQALAFDVPVMIGASFACLPVFFAGARVTRKAALFLLAGYGGYVLWLVLDSMGSPWLDPLRDGLLLFFLPCAAFALAYITWRELRDRRAAGGGSPPRG